MKSLSSEENARANELVSHHRRQASCNGLESLDYISTLWRYMDLPKFLSMLATNSLPLIRLDTFDDQWEGYSEPLQQNDYRGFFKDSDRAKDEHRFSQSRLLRQSFFASCWHLSDIESDAMWKLYMTGSDGVAIRTTFKNLVYSLRDATQEFVVGRVRYTRPSPGCSMLLACMTKREPFAHENEVRIIWHDPKHEEQNTDASIFEPSTPEQQTRVVSLSCDYSELISEIRVSPKAGSWFLKAIRDLLAKYGLGDVNVTQSVLAGNPQWPT